MIQYGNYKNAASILANSGTNFRTMSAAVVYIQDQTEISHLEIPDYRKRVLSVTCIYNIQTQLWKRFSPMLAGRRD